MFSDIVRPNLMGILYFKTIVIFIKRETDALDSLPNPASVDMQDT